MGVERAPLHATPTGVSPMPFALPVLFDLTLILALASALRLLAVRGRDSERLARQLAQVRDEGHLCSRHVRTLSELNRALQSSETLDQAIELTVPYLQRLFGVPAGALYVAGPPGTALYCVHQWGDRGLPDTVQPGDCRALSNGKAYAQPQAPDPRRCRHLFSQAPAAGRSHPLAEETPESDALGDAPKAAPCGRGASGDRPSHDLCVPLAVNGVTLALLNLHEPNGRAGELLGSPYVVSAIEQISLAIWNLRLRETLRQQSIRDPLTKLYNRRYLEESLLREVSRAERSQSAGASTGLGVLMIDVDHFKRCNDVYGHEAGDLLLAEIGGLLRSMTRASDIASRYGGEEFVVALADVTLQGACGCAEEIRSAVRSLEISFEGRQLPPTSISVGVAVYPEHGETPAALIRAADAAMYLAKREGRDRVRVASLSPRATV
jgi:diguanylate cyclase (GGDEF)-like protein